MKLKQGKVVKGKDLPLTEGFEPPIKSQRGINSKTVESPMLTSSHVYIPPGGKNQLHYHNNNDAGGYIIKGRVKMYFGPPHDQTTDIAEAGDFFYYPRGTPHGLENVGDDTAEMIAFYGGVGSAEDSATVFLEPVADKYKKK